MVGHVMLSWFINFMWEIFLDLAIINKALEVSFPFTSCLMTNSNASKRLPFPMSTFVHSFYFYTADRCGGNRYSPSRYIPSTVLAPQETCSLVQLSPRCSTPTWNVQGSPAEQAELDKHSYTPYILSSQSSLSWLCRALTYLKDPMHSVFLRTKSVILDSSTAIK